MRTPSTTFVRTLRVARHITVRSHLAGLTAGAVQG